MPPVSSYTALMSVISRSFIERAADDVFVLQNVGVNLGLPPVWMIYLPVGDLAESLRRVEEEGGKVIKATRGTDGAYAYAAVQDPVGACLALVPG